MDFLFYHLKLKHKEQSCSKYYLPIGEINNYIVMKDGQSIFDRPVRNVLIKYDNIRKIATGQGDDYTTGYLLDYNYFKKHYRLTAINLR